MPCLLWFWFRCSFDVNLGFTVDGDAGLGLVFCLHVSFGLMMVFSLKFILY